MYFYCLNMLKGAVVSVLEWLSQRENSLPVHKLQIGSIVKGHTDGVFYARVVSIDEYLQKAHLPLSRQIKVDGGQELCLEVLTFDSPQYTVMPISRVYSINPKEEIEGVRKRAEKEIFDAQFNNNPEETLNAQRMYRYIEILQKLIKE